jgi:hypothetical protein
MSYRGDHGGQNFRQPRLERHVAVVTRGDDQEFFGETRKLLEVLMRLNRSARPVFEEGRADGVAIDIVRMPWDGEGAAVLGEIGDLIARTARAARKRWNPSAHRWEPIV